MKQHLAISWERPNKTHSCFDGKPEPQARIECQTLPWRIQGWVCLSDWSSQWKSKRTELRKHPCGQSHSTLWATGEDRQKSKVPPNDGGFFFFFFFFEKKKHVILLAQTVKCLPTMWETWVRSLGQEDRLEKEMATHSSTLAWKIPWTVEPGSLQSMGLQRVRHDWVTKLSNFHTYTACTLEDIQKFLFWWMDVWIDSGWAGCFHPHYQLRRLQVSTICWWVMKLNLQPKLSSWF